jgi:hypothetical protein
MQPATPEQPDVRTVMDRIVGRLLSWAGLATGSALLILSVALHMWEAAAEHAEPSVWLGLVARVSGEVGAVMVAFALLHVTYDRYTRDAWSRRVEKAIHDQTSFSHVGMKCASPRLSNTEVGDLIRNARHLRVLKTWFPETDDMLAAFQTAVGQAEKIEILLCHPDSPILTLRSEGAGCGAGDGAACVRRTLRTIGEACGACKSDPFLRLNLGLYDAWPGCPVICADGRILLGFYFRGHASPATPWIEVWPGSDLSKLIDEQFESLWKHGNTVTISKCADLARWATS